MIWLVNYDISKYNTEKDDLLHKYWQGKKATLSENDIFEIYRLDYKFHEDMVYGYDLILEESIFIYDLC